MPVLTANPFWAWCDEDYDGRSGVVYSLEGNRSYTRIFKVKVLLKEMSSVAVCLCPYLPKPMSLYSIVVQVPEGLARPSRPVLIEQDPLALLTEMSAEPMVKGDWQIWLVTCKYNTHFGTRTDNPSKSSNDPSIEIADVAWGHETIREARPRDLNGAPYITTAGQPYSPAITYPVDYPTLSFSRNELSFNAGIANQYAHTLNLDTFLGYPPGTAIVESPDSVQKNKGLLRYQRTSYKMKFRALQKGGKFILPKLNVILPIYDLDTQEFLGYKAFPNTTDLVDSWQPLEIMKGMYRRGGSRPNDLAEVKGLPVPIFRFGQQVHHDVLLNDIGDESKPTDPNDPGTTPVWYKQFINHRSTSFADLLKNGVSGYGIPGSG